MSAPGDTQLLHAEIQGRAVQSQARRCAAASGKNPPGFFQGLEDMGALDLFQSLMAACVLTWRDPRIQVPERKPQDRTGAQNYRAFDYVLQLPDVARPSVMNQSLHRFRGNRIDRLAHSSCGLLYKMLHQQRNILRTFPQGRNVDRKHIQAIIEIAAKLLVQDHSFQVTMGRGHNAHICFLCPRATQPLKFPLLQDTEKLWLQLERDIADFIQEQRALMCYLKSAELLCDRTGNPCSFMAKQFTFEQPGRDGSTVGVNERSSLARTETVNGARDEFFARASLA